MKSHIFISSGNNQTLKCQKKVMRSLMSQVKTYLLIGHMIVLLPRQMEILCFHALPFLPSGNGLDGMNDNQKPEGKEKCFQMFAWFHLTVSINN